MAILSDASRLAGRDDCIRRIAGKTGVVKEDLAAAFNALDQFVSDNAVAINNAIPLPARTALTTSQKALLFQFVLEHRYRGGL